MGQGWAPEGAHDESALSPPTCGWLWGEPDLVLTLPEYALRADGADVYRNFVVTVPGRGTRFERGLQFRPRSRGVHHANIRIDPTPASPRARRRPTVARVRGHDSAFRGLPDGHFLG
jgi:hypothetical protein